MTCTIRERLELEAACSTDEAERRVIADALAEIRRLDTELGDVLHEVARHQVAGTTLASQVIPGARPALQVRYVLGMLAAEHDRLRKRLAEATTPKVRRVRVRVRDEAAPEEPDSEL